MPVRQQCLGSACTDVKGRFTFAFSHEAEKVTVEAGNQKQADASGNWQLTESKEYAVEQADEV